MAIHYSLKVAGSDAWQFHHDLPVFWPWLFDGTTITESRRLHTTVFDAADRFAARMEQLGRLPYFSPISRAFEEIRPDQFPRALGVNPDTLITLDLGEVERRRPYDHEAATAYWAVFFQQCDRGELGGALAAWEKATLSPLRFAGGQQHDARALAAAAVEMRLTTSSQDRARVLAQLLFGVPHSRPAKALTHQWSERLSDFPPVHFTEKVTPIRAMLRKFFQPGDKG
ncbi:MAG: hypothetical protein JJU11_15480 [Candidatus Sumerlaeia bacterium]|nr:hypothetical protein [Candidatus Sumerlaeia bacterium]